MSDTRPSEKRCHKCGEIKPVDMFHRNKSSKDSLDNRCKACSSSAHAAYYIANREMILARCADYRRIYPDKRYATHTAYRAANREIVNARNADYRRKYPDRIRAERTTYRAAHLDLYRAACARRIARLKASDGAGFSSDELTTMRKTQNGICAYCQYQYDPDHLQMDHISPLAQGGRHESGNICLACPKCNLSKNNRTPDQWQNRWYYHQSDPYAEHVFGRWSE